MLGGSYRTESSLISMGKTPSVPVDACRAGVTLDCEGQVPVLQGEELHLLREDIYRATKVSQLLSVLLSDPPIFRSEVLDLLPKRR